MGIVIVEVVLKVDRTVDVARIKLISVDCATVRVVLMVSVSVGNMVVVVLGKVLVDVTITVIDVDTVVGMAHKTGYDASQGSAKVVIESCSLSVGAPVTKAPAHGNPLSTYTMSVTGTPQTSNKSATAFNCTVSVGTLTNVKLSSEQAL